MSLWTAIVNYHQFLLKLDVDGGASLLVIEPEVPAGKQNLQTSRLTKSVTLTSSSFTTVLCILLEPKFGVYMFVQWKTHAEGQHSFSNNSGLSIFVNKRFDFKFLGQLPNDLLQKLYWTISKTYTLTTSNCLLGKLSTNSYAVGLTLSSHGPVSFSVFPLSHLAFWSLLLLPPVVTNFLYWLIVISFINILEQLLFHFLQVNWISQPSDRYTLYYTYMQQIQNQSPLPLW